MSAMIFIIAPDYTPATCRMDHYLFPGLLPDYSDEFLVRKFVALTQQPFISINFIRNYFSITVPRYDPRSLFLALSITYSY